MKKICYVVTIPGTIESFFIPQLQYLARQGFDVSVICSSSDTLQGMLGPTVHYIPLDMPRGVSVIGSLQAIYGLYRIFQREHFDLIQYSTPNAAVYVSIAARLVGCKIRNYHLMGLRYLGAHGVGRFILKTLEKIACFNSTSIESISNSNLEMGIDEGLYTRDKATIVWNGSTGGVDLKRFDISKREKWRHELRQELGYAKDDFIFGFVGRITRDKGINELLEAYMGLGGNAKLFLIGNKENMASLEQSLLAKAKQNPNIKYHESARDIEHYFAMIDVLLLPRYREGFGNVVIEAAAMGTPAIVSDIPGPIDTIKENETALVCRVKDAADLQRQMENMMHGLCKDMGVKAHNFVKMSFDSEELCKHVLARKEKLLGEIH